MGFIQTLATYLIPGYTAAKATEPPRMPYLGYGGTGFSAFAETYSDSPSGWMLAARYNVWARNCIAARKSFVSKADLKLYRGEGQEREEIPDHPVLALLREVNPVNANRKSFKRTVEDQLATFGRCLVLKVTGERLLEPRELYVLPAQMVEVIPDPVRWVGGYRWLPTGQIYAPDEIVDLYYPANDGTPAASSPTAAAVGAINRYALADLAQASIDKRGGQGGGIVFYPDNLDPAEFERLKAEWERIRSNPNNAGRDVHVSAALKYESGALTARDMQREERSQRLMKEIMAAYQVPPAIAGDYSDASVLANAAVQDRSFAEGWGVEELEFIEEAFNNQLLWQHWPETRDQEMYLAHDLDDIPALQENEAERANVLKTKLDTAVMAVAGNLWSLNEARRYTDQTPIKDPRADVVPVIEEPKPAEPAQSAGQADQAPPTAPTKATRVIADYVGVTVRTPAGDGTIERIVRFGDVGGRTATKAQPLFIVDGQAWTADELQVIDAPAGASGGDDGG